MSLVLQPRDRLVTDALHQWIRIILLTQVAELWSADISNTRKRMTRLARAGWVNQICVHGEPPPDVSRPLYKSGDNFDPEEISHAARKRYHVGPSARRMVAYEARSGTLSRVKPHQISHDAGLTAVWVLHVAKLSRWPIADWVPEDHFPPRAHGCKVEDALLCTGGDVNQPYLAIDYAGKYSAERLIALAHDISKRDLPFIFF